MFKVIMRKLSMIDIFPLNHLQKESQNLTWKKCFAIVAIVLFLSLFLRLSIRDGEMGQQLRSLAIFAEDLSSILSIILSAKGI